MAEAVAQTNPFQQGSGLFLFVLGTGPPPEAADNAAGEEDILEGVQFRKKMELLENEANAPSPDLGRFRGSQSLNLSAFQADDAGVRAVQEPEQVKQGALAAP